jgi:hypothetical protein
MVLSDIARRMMLMTDPDKTHTVDELLEIVREMREIFAASQEIWSRPDWRNSDENCLECDRLVSKYFELNGIAHKHPALREVREILRRERKQQERS